MKKNLSCEIKRIKILLSESPSVSNKLLGDKTVKIPRDGAHAGQKGWPSNNAWDIAGAIGDPVYSLTNGKLITFSDYGDKVIKTQGKKLYGTSFTVQGLDGSPDVYYTHLKNVQVKKGDKVTCGQLLGYIMDFPDSSNDHVHIGVKPPSTIRDLISPDGKILCSKNKSFVPLSTKTDPNQTQSDSDEDEISKLIKILDSEISGKKIKDLAGISPNDFKTEKSFYEVFIDFINSWKNSPK